MKMSKKGKRHLWKCMAIYVVVLIALSIIAVSCSEKQAATPRPAAYPRVERTYDTTYTCAYPELNIMLNANAEISGNDSGFSVRYAKYGASFFCSYERIGSHDDFIETMLKKEGMTIGDAKKLIDNLPVTAQQMVYMDRLKLDYDKNINRAEATKLITSKLNYLNKIEQRPASEAQVSLLDKRGIKHSENVTVAEFNEKIYFGKPTTKQINYLNLHRIEYDKEKICYGKARNLIDINKKYIAQRRELPATEKQIDYLKNNGIEYKEGITSGQASDIIDNHMTAAKEARQQGSNEPLTEKQKAFLEERGLPTDIGKKEAVQIIGRTMNMEKIQNFTEAKNVNKPTIYEEYRALAKKQIESGKEIDDKKIAAELLKRGHSEKYVQKAIFSCSPANDYNNSLKAVKAAAKMPTVKKAMEKSADRGR